MDASTTTKASTTQPAFIGGVVMGVLSALPIISAGNVCCCLWVLTGGAVAAYFLQQNQSEPLTPGDGALVGLLAGIIGAFVTMVLSIPIGLATLPMQRALAERALQAPGELPPAVRQFLENSARGAVNANPFVRVVLALVGLMFYLVIGAIFSTLGGVLGALVFKGRTPPAPHVPLDQPPSFGA